MLQNKFMKHLLFTAFLLLGVISYAQTKVIVPHPETGREMFYWGIKIISYICTLKINVLWNYSKDKAS